MCIVYSPLEFSCYFFNIGRLEIVAKLQPKRDHDLLRRKMHRENNLYALDASSF